jgi:hypothetical protein
MERETSTQPSVTGAVVTTAVLVAALVVLAAPVAALLVAAGVALASLIQRLTRGGRTGETGANRQQGSPTLAPAD